MASTLAQSEPPNGPQEDELDRIPSSIASVVGDPAAQASNASGKLYVEGDAIGASAQSYSAAAGADATEVGGLFLLDVRETYTLSQSLNAGVSARANGVVGDTPTFTGATPVRIDPRELYFDYHPGATTFIDVGRVNLKEGIASGYNPTDLFRAGSNVDPLSIDPAIIRENRLGSVMLHAQELWSGGNASLAYSPKLESEPRLAAAPATEWINAALGKTNGEQRGLLGVTQRVAPDVAPEISYQFDGTYSSLDANVSKSLDANAVAYVEWSGAHRRSIVADAIRFNQQTADVPLTPVAAPSSLLDATRFRNDSVVGLSYTLPFDAALTLEFHVDDTGLTRHEVQTLFAANPQPVSSSARISLAQYVELYATDQGRIIARDSAFVRFGLPTATTSAWNWSVFGLVDTDDGSALLESSGEYRISAHFTVSALVSFFTGGSHSLYGAFGSSPTYILKLRAYL
jgi:hypothetical protein